MITIKLKYNNFEEIKEILNPYIHQYNCVLRYCYNRVQDNKNIGIQQLDELTKNLNNVDLMDASLMRNAIKEALSMRDKEEVIFGGKYNFFKRKFGKIDKSTYLENRNVPLYLIGSKADPNGNRKAELDIIDNNSIILKFNKQTHLNIQLPKLTTKLKNQLMKLQLDCESGKTGFSLKVDNKHVYIVIDEIVLSDEQPYNFIGNRILSFDLNPNYIALSVIDWNEDESNNIIHKEIIDLKELNKLPKKQNTKIKHELVESSKYIVELAKHYQCETISMEDLSIESSNKNKGKKFNKLVNNDWKRNLVVNNITKRCNIEKIKHVKVFAPYTSFIGQVVNYNDYDSIAASIEISRRSMILKKNNNFAMFSIKNHINYPKFNIDGFLATRWKEMPLNNLSQCKNWLKLYESIKKSGNSYRLLFSKKEFNGVSFSLVSFKSNVQRHLCH